MKRKDFNDLLKSIKQAKKIHKNRFIPNSSEEEKERYWEQIKNNQRLFLKELNKQKKITDNAMNKLLLKYNVDFKDIILDFISSGWDCKETKKTLIFIRK